ncbi:NAD(P)-binding protein [Setomelanomma holmii]|uniref:NAD(P)-binding protein n=1 Tax=Setomelanomma holmii TaxID=210430 RepID=A0A9P4LKH4_9PLEO|nr:NAD(P)-binding protein [Setomelanomma holmii]
MLVLVAGITGNIGRLLAPALIERGHQVRGLGRSPAKLARSSKEQLESFVTNTAYYDITALEKACQGVDAVVCAYKGSPELLLEGQLLLFRTAERAGVKHFVPASFNYDWRTLTLGQQDSYDPYISFYNHLQLVSSPASPHLSFVFTGVLAEVLFGSPGHAYFTTKNHGPWDLENKKMEIWGDQNRKWNWTSEKDVARFVAGLLSLPAEKIKEKEFWNVSSGVDTLSEIARTYGKLRGREVEIVRMGSVEEMREKAFEARKRGKRSAFWEYIGWFYNLWTVEGIWLLGELDNGEIGVEGEGLEAFLKRYSDV